MSRGRIRKIITDAVNDILGPVQGAQYNSTSMQRTRRRGPVSPTSYSAGYRAKSTRGARTKAGYRMGDSPSKNPVVPTGLRKKTIYY